MFLIFVYYNNKKLNFKHSKYWMVAMLQGEPKQKSLLTTFSLNIINSKFLTTEMIFYLDVKI